MRKPLLILVLFLLSAALLDAGDRSGSFYVDGKLRSYIVHLPGKKDTSLFRPLVIVLHGGGGTAKGMIKFSGFNGLADKEGFIAVYPSGLDKQWSDGRTGEKLPEKRDDVKFISMLIDTLSVLYNIDTARVFATGISNGGFFSIYLAYKLGDKIKAIAPVCAGIPEDIAEGFKTSGPVPMLLINGTEDKLVKYDGGIVGFNERWGRGKNISTDETVRIWRGLLECAKEPETFDMPDKDEDDGCIAERTVYAGCKGGSTLQLIKITGGGHTWPGGSQYLPRFIVGRVCRDFNAEEVIWDFFKKLPALNNGH